VIFGSTDCGFWWHRLFNLKLLYNLFIRYFRILKRKTDIIKFKLYLRKSRRIECQKKQLF